MRVLRVFGDDVADRLRRAEARRRHEEDVEEEGRDEAARVVRRDGLARHEVAPERRQRARRRLLLDEQLDLLQSWYVTQGFDCEGGREKKKGYKVVDDRCGG